MFANNDLMKLIPNLIVAETCAYFDHGNSSYENLHLI